MSRFLSTVSRLSPALLVLVAWFALSAHVRAQTLDLYNVDISGYPTIRADYRATNASGAEYTDLSNSDFHIIELLSNGRKIDVTASVTQDCITKTEEKPVSLLIVLDRSTSMDDDVGNTTRLDVAKNALRQLIDRLEMVPGTKVCLMTFAQRSRLECDWTTSKTTFRTAVNNVRSSPWTNYYAVFNEPQTVFEKFRECDPAIAKRLIFITDGNPNPDIQDQDDFIDFVTTRALQQSIEIHAISIDKETSYPGLDSICKRTGGSAHVGTSSNLQAMLDAVQTLPTVTRTCHIEWTSVPACGPPTPNRLATVTLLRGVRPSDSVAYVADVPSVLLPVSFNTTTPVPQASRVIVELGIQPPTTIYADLSTLDVDISYPPHLLHYLGSSAANTNATFVSQNGQPTGSLRFRSSLAQPFDSAAVLRLEFLSLLSVDTVATLTADVSTDITCLTTPIISGEQIVSRSCAGTMRIVSIGATPFAIQNIFPTVTSDRVSVTYSTGYHSDVAFDIVDGYGHVVSRHTLANQPAAAYSLDMPVQELPSGVYFVRMTSGHFADSRRFSVVK